MTDGFTYPTRFRSDAASALLAAAAPLPAASGQMLRHLLDLAGNRQLNRALHTIRTA